MNGREVGDYLTQLATALEVIRKECGESGWWVVGGLANEAYFDDANFDYHSEIHGLRDLDILCCLDLLPSLYKARRINQTPVYIDVVYHSILHIFTTGEAYLKKGKVRLPIESQVIETQQVTLRGVTFPTLPPQTLQHIYCVAIAILGPLRPKDRDNAKKLGRVALRGRGFPTYPHEYYESWHRFLKQVGSNPGLMLITFRIFRILGIKHLLPFDHPLVQPLMQRVWDTINGR